MSDRPTLTLADLEGSNIKGALRAIVADLSDGEVMTMGDAAAETQCSLSQAHRVAKDLGITIEARVRGRRTTLIANPATVKAWQEQNQAQETATG